MNNQHQQESAEYSRAWMAGAESVQAQDSPAKTRFYAITLWAEFGYSVCTDSENLPSLQGTPGEVREGEAVRSDYQERFDLLYGEFCKVAERHLCEGGQSYEQVLPALEKILALHNKIIAVPAAGWWAGMGVDLAGHAKDDFKKMSWVLRFYAQSA